MLINIIHNEFQTKNKASGNSNALLWIVLISLLLGASFFMGKLRRIKVDLTNKRFGDLVAISYYKDFSKPGYVWICKCDCGKECKVRSSNLIQGHTKSCGCKKSNYIHGKTYSTEWYSYIGMIRRCYDKKCNRYNIYGNRGIVVCERWLDSFENFYADMGKKPSAKHSLDRIDVNGNYEQKNCRWADDITQSRNRRNVKIITINGLSMTIPEWAERQKISAKRIRSRIYYGWSCEEAILTPIKSRL